MTSQIHEEDANAEGGMSEHLQRYRKYIDSLKDGRSSGISSVFGRASDLLPPDVLEIKPPTALAEGFVTAHLQDAEEYGVDEGHGQHKSDNAESYVENETDDPGTINDHSEEDENEDLSSDKEDDLEPDEEDSDFETDDSDEDDELDDDDLEQDDDEDDSSEIADDQTEQLTVKSAQGTVLWTIYFNRVEPLSITMMDGSSVKNAEGRDDSILALKTNVDQFKFFILSGLVIDPLTGNIYVESNDGAFTAAFLNNGWQIHQYRNHEGDETYYATEPYKPGRERLTMQIKNVLLDPVHGEVSYDSLDGSASMTLKSRKLLRAAES